MAAIPIIARLRDDKSLVDTVFKAGKYLTFRVARQDFAMNIAFVRSILPVHQMTAIGDHGWLCGFAAISGREFPVIDLRAKLGIAQGSQGREPFIIVVETDEKLVGFIADRVSEVVDLRARDFRNGAVRSTGRVRRVLEPAQMMSEKDWSTIGLSLRA
jgi:chemotaxis signal transduction protein